MSSREWSLRLGDVLSGTLSLLAGEVDLVTGLVDAGGVFLEGEGERLAGRDFDGGVTFPGELLPLGWDLGGEVDFRGERLLMSVGGRRIM